MLEFQRAQFESSSVLLVLKNVWYDITFMFQSASVNFNYICNLPVKIVVVYVDKSHFYCFFNCK